MKIFYGFLILVTVAVLWMLPVTEAVYEFRTDIRSDAFDVTTAAGVTAANVTLHTAIYDSDIQTIVYSSDNTSDTPAYSDYDSNTRRLEVSGLNANDTRTLDIAYDVDALNASTAVSTFLDTLAWIWFILLAAFPAAAIAAIFLGRAG